MLEKGRYYNFQYGSLNFSGGFEMQPKLDTISNQLPERYFGELTMDKYGGKFIILCLFIA